MLLWDGAIVNSLESVDERIVMCESCGYELPLSEFCCYDGPASDGSITEAYCKQCCGPHSRIWDGKAVGGGTFERGE